MYCIALYCNLLYSIDFHLDVLHCIVVFCILSSCIVFTSASHNTFLYFDDRIVVIEDHLSRLPLLHSNSGILGFLTTIANEPFSVTIGFVYLASVYAILAAVLRLLL